MRTTLTFLDGNVNRERSVSAPQIAGAGEGEAAKQISPVIIGRNGSGNKQRGEDEPESSTAH